MRTLRSGSTALESPVTAGASLSPAARSDWRATLASSSFRLAGALICLALGTATGCGGSDDDADQRAVDRAQVLHGPLRNLVTNRDISKTSPNSAERALLSWFQAVQFEDVIGTKILVNRAELERVGEVRVANATQIVGAALGKPSIVSVARDGRNASIRTLIRAFAAGKREAVSAEPKTFQMVRSAGSWKLADVTYLLKASDAIRRSRGPGG